MTRKEFLQTLGIGAATIAISNLPGASLVQAAEAATPEKPLPKNTRISLQN